MKIAIIGTGYVGLVVGAGLADFGHEVACTDRDESKIALLSSGTVPIYEPGLDRLVERNLADHRLRFTTDIPSAVSEAELVFIAVSTPGRADDGQADLANLFEAATAVGEALTGFTVIAVKSTVPAGASDEVERRIRAIRPDADFVVVSNPEFIREGVAIEDLRRPERIIIGAHEDRAVAVLREAYRPLLVNDTPLLVTGRRTAELIKYASNAFLAMKVAFINEVADMCDAVGADIQDVSRGMGLDSRIGKSFLQAGPGFGGSTFPADARAFARSATLAGSQLSLVEATIAANAHRKRAMADRIVAACGGDVRGKIIAVLGLTYKPNSEDLREAPSLDIIPALQAAGASVCAFDPSGGFDAERLMPGVMLSSGPYLCMAGADALVILTEWNEFRALDLNRIKAALKSPVVVDLRNIYDPAKMAEAGLTYTCVGRAGARVG